MTRRRMITLLFLALMLAGLIGCSRATGPAGTSATAGPVENPQFSRKPPAANWSSFRTKNSVKPVKPDREDNPLAVDLRLGDLSKIDLTQSGDVLMNYAVFDTDTKWPAQMPEGFDPQKIMELGRNPGLGVRDLQKEGITGKGVHVAFLDQALLLEHQEYAGHILKYDEIGRVAPQAEMHGAAVTSILAGKTVGVAPDVIITYYAVQVSTGNNQTTFKYLAQGINRILDDNAGLPDAEKIRVIGMAIGWDPNSDGYAEIDQAVKRAKQEGVFVLSSSTERYYSFKYHGLNREPLADPENYQSYGPGTWWRDQYFKNYLASDQYKQYMDGRIMVPMDSRTTAAPTGTSAYAFYRQGGWSWVVPYLEGVYAMGLQVRPQLTPDEFYKAALETGWYTTVTRDGKQYKLGPIINPSGIIKNLRSK